MTSTPDEIEADVIKWIPWVKKNAARFHRTRFEYDDMVSEGMVALWEGRKAWSEDSGYPVGAYMVLEVKHHWFDITERGTMTGMPRLQGKVAKELRWGEVAIDFQVPANEDIHPMSLPVVDDLTYHQAEIHEAIDGLTPKQKRYVLARFWVGMKQAEINEYMGVLGHGIWARVRPKLRDELAHLEGVV